MVTRGSEIDLSSMRWVKSLANKVWEWLARPLPEDDPDAPKHDPSYYENPHGGGSGGG
jgi:hypothetical protein